MQTAMGSGSSEREIWLALQMGWKIPHHQFKTHSFPGGQKMCSFPLVCVGFALHFKGKAATPGNSLAPGLLSGQQLDQVAQLLNFKVSVPQSQVSPTKLENEAKCWSWEHRPSPTWTQWLYSIYEADLSLHLLSEFWPGKKAGGGKRKRGKLLCQNEEDVQEQVSWLVHVIQQFVGPLPPGPRLECSSSTDSPSVSYSMLLARPLHSFI